MRRTSLLFVLSTSALISFTGIAEAARSIILIPGSGGAVPTDFLMRNRSAFTSLGSVFVTTNGNEVPGLAKAEKAKGNTVIIVGMSAGVTKAGVALRGGAAPSALVLVSGNYGRLMSTVGSSSALPPTLVVHHPLDACPETPASAAAQFASWGAGKVTIRMISESGPEAPDPCGARAAHGFYTRDANAIAAIVAFISSR